MSKRLSCGVCERRIMVPSDTSDVVLCRFCSAYPVLVAAFIEGRSRLLAEACE